MTKSTNARITLSLAYLAYLRLFARVQLAKIRPTIIGITGSAGKTSLLLAITAILQKDAKVKVSHQANSESGIPLNILGIQPRDYSHLDWTRMALLAPFKLLTNWQRYEYYVAEMGIDRPEPPKNMEYLLTVLQPTIGVFMNALPVHGQYFDKLVPPEVLDPHQRREKMTDAIANEKGKLIRSLPTSGTAILNLDDSRVRRFVHRTKAQVMTFATRGRADLRAWDITLDRRGFSMSLSEGTRMRHLSVPLLLPRHYAQTFLAAVAVGRACGRSLDSCIESLSTSFRLPPGRMTVLPGIKATTILDSSYNASPQTVEGALELLDRVATGRKVAVLGDMRELGSIARQEHEALAVKVATIADLVVTVGPLMRDCFVPKLLSLGFSSENLASFLDPFRAAQSLAKLVRTGDTILVKGSQNTIFLEIVVEKLLKDPNDATRLCRRSHFWQRQRKKLSAQGKNQAS